MIVRARAPLRLGFAGGGTDLSPFCDRFGGQVLNATIGLYAYTHLAPSDDDRVEFRAADFDAVSAERAAPRIEASGPLALHKAVYNRIVRDYRKGEPLALRMVTHCDAPPGSGLGSSSTLVVSMIKAFVEWLHLPLGEYDVAHLAYEIERRDLGFSGGRQDSYAATFGGINFMEFYADDRTIVNPLRVKNWILSELESSLVLYFTGVSRVSSTIIDEQTRNVVEGNAAAIEALKELKEDAVGMKEALLKGEFDKFAHYLGRSWSAKKRTASSVSNARIDEGFEVARRAGALAGKVSGAGGGGFAMFVTDPARRANVMSALQKLGGTAVTCRFTKNGTEGWRVE
jgi:D-glycero-alpha-D-manno-heptose-7-phosphate kinase